MQQWVQRPSRGRRRCSNGGFEEGRWNVIPDCCSEWARSAFWCLVWSTPNGTRVCGGNEAAPAFALHRGTTVSQRGDDAGAPLSMWPLALHYIAALCQYCRVSPSHCFLYRLILPNPGNPTVARVKYQAPAVSPLTFFSDVIFLSSFLHTGLQLWKSDTWQVSVGFDWSNFLVNLSGQGAPYIKWDEAMFRWCNVCRSCEKKVPALHWMMNGSKLCDVGDTQQRLTWSWFSHCSAADLFIVLHLTHNVHRRVCLFYSFKCSSVMWHFIWIYWLYWNIKYVCCVFLFA